MGKTYHRAPEEVEDLMDEVRSKHHERLLAIETPVTIGILMVWGDCNDNGQLLGPELTLHGVLAAAMVKANNLKLRAYGLSDVEMLIDQYTWDKSTPRGRLALIDHELTHIELVQKDNSIVLDDLGRPKINMRPHDWHFGWFDEVAERHGKHSFESTQAKKFQEVSGQLYLNL